MVPTRCLPFPEAIMIEVVICVAVRTPFFDIKNASARGPTSIRGLSVSDVGVTSTRVFVVLCECVGALDLRPDTFNPRIRVGQSGRWLYDVIRCH